MRKTPALLALLLGSGIAAPAAAQKFYDVEVVVFEHLRPDAGETERWRPQVVVPPIAQAAAFEARGPRADRLRELPDGFERLPRGESQMGRAVRRLERSDRYRVLRHALWRQPALGAEEAVALRFGAGNPTAVRIPASAYPAAPIEADVRAAGTNPDQSSATVRSSGADGVRTSVGDGAGRQSRVGSHDNNGARTYLLESPFGLGMVAPPLRNADILPLDGTVKLVVSRYLHLHADLYYTTAVEWTDERESGQIAATGAGSATGAATPPRSTRISDGRSMLSYPFQQQRRMRSGELHYLDHPVIGLLVKVTPHEQG